MKHRISCITLGVDDLERSLTFYRDGLGLETKGIFGQEFEDGAVVFFDMNEGLKLALFPRESLAKDAKIPVTARGSSDGSIARNDDGRSTIVFSTPSGSQRVTADQVVLALPFAVLRTLDYSGANFDPLKKTAITQLGNGRNSKLQLQFASRLWNTEGAWGLSNGSTYADTGYQNTWEVTRAQSGATGILVDYTGGDIAGALSAGTPYASAASAKVANLAQRFLKQLEPVFPGITKQWNGKATLSTPMLDPNLNCSYSYWKVGQYVGFSGWEALRQGDIHFAGEHCSQDFQGYMEGGAREGGRAALEVFHALTGR